MYFKTFLFTVRPADEPDNEELHKKLCLDDLVILIHSRRLRWFGHVERSSGEISSVRSMSIAGKRGLGSQAQEDMV